jgi:hypothetical protein
MDRTSQQFRKDSFVTQPTPSIVTFGQRFARPFYAGGSTHDVVADIPELTFAAVATPLPVNKYFPENPANYANGSQRRLANQLSRGKIISLTNAKCVVFR